MRDWLDKLTFVDYCVMIGYFNVFINMVFGHSDMDTYQVLLLNLIAIKLIFDRRLI